MFFLLNCLEKVKKTVFSPPPPPNLLALPLPAAAGCSPAHVV
jgi:hypothetical protein